MPGEEKKTDQKRTKRYLTIASAVLADGRIVEMVLPPDGGNTLLCMGKADKWKLVKSVSESGHSFRPYPSENNLLRHRVLLLPSKPVEFGGNEQLVADIRAFIHQYVDLSPEFESIASYYVLLSWVYDSFNELPYLRFRGDYGSGKTRALLVVGSICYKPLFAGGASTVSPLFRMLDSIRGTLIVDEADFRVSDEKAEVIKILNNGNAKGFPVLRSEVSKTGTYTPQAYTVFGPKLVATRSNFQDQALESRCLTEELGRRRLRSDIPLSLPASFGDEALNLRNKLLLYRLRNAGRVRLRPDVIDKVVEPRLRQVFAPLVSLVTDEDTRANIAEIATRYHEHHKANRSSDVEIRVLEAIGDLLTGAVTHISIDDIRSAFLDRFGLEYEHTITHRWIGSVVRKELHLQTQKRNGVYVIPASEFKTIAYLLERYGLDEGVSSDQTPSPTSPTSPTS